ncbi:uncharacterized protein LOC123535091 [Mercenaria mercenaria]|uniref:uncharacterized protein LOC123535091 n=1 Tax=Mercenaria mercenaria TaxID=6596 RepID=UPI00234EA9C6|nr:uncharacterized protein LOC123535091 [Mercenaria mercenaria]XP_053374959.1 uncharacterized protein LOC123535091 [Mercenaria mercenaria]XP_053374960.1 uncharacterized protein LOC123535091 [Mercenaria mercenaria]XP_053374961.1 uncharacterized protein LOC123535091 [Mercenaria mercenaria]
MTTFITLQNELTGSSEEKNTHRISYDDDYFEYSHKKMFSSVSKAKNENQECFNYKKKTSHLENCYDKTLSQLEANHVKKKSHLGVNHEKETSRLGALEPLEKTINVLGETRNRHRFTIPICRRNEEHLEPVNIVDETYKDVIHNTDKNRKEVVFAMSSATKLTGDDADILTHDYKNRGFSTEKACKDVLSDTALLFQTVSDADDKQFKNKKTLTHSQSEQCLSGHFSNSKRSHRNGRKHNVVSPVSKDTFIFSEMQNEGNYLSERTNDISIPIISEYSVTSKVKRKKRKPFGKKHCSDSMIELHYEKEKY